MPVPQTQAWKEDLEMDCRLAAVVASDTATVKTDCSCLSASTTLTQKVQVPRLAVHTFAVAAGVHAAVAAPESDQH